MPISGTAENNMKIILYLTLSICMILSGRGVVAAERVALVIGNSAYASAPRLINPRNDAADMAAKFEALGFDVVRGFDLDYQGMRDTLAVFRDRLKDAEIALFFYAGHGLQVNGENFAMPVDAETTAVSAIEDSFMPVGAVIATMEREAKVTLVFLDACRDNPLAGTDNLQGTGSARGLASIGSSAGTLIAFSTQPGNVALDGAGRNSPYSAALLKYLGKPGEDLMRTLVAVRNQVLSTTDRRQVPWENSSLTGLVMLSPSDRPSADTAVRKRPPTDSPLGAVVERSDRFTRFSCGQIVDARTGLAWFVGPDRHVVWQEARNYIADLDACGSANWRMPSGRELKSLFDPRQVAGTGIYYKGRYWPAKMDGIFRDIGGGSWVWASRDLGRQAESYNFNQGMIVRYDKGDTRYSTRVSAVHD